MRRLIVMLGFALVTAIVAFFIYTTLSGDDTEAPTAPSGGLFAPAATTDAPSFLRAGDAPVIASYRVISIEPPTLPSSADNSGAQARWEGQPAGHAFHRSS